MMSNLKIVSLDDICDLNMGQSPESSSYNEEKIGIPFFQGNADFGELYPITRYWCSEPTKIANKDDILISVRAPIGALNIATEKCCIGRGLAALTALPNTYNKYLFYALKSKYDELNAKGTGSTFKAINKKTLTETSIQFTSLETQKKIADVLDKAKSLIDLRKKQIEKMDLLIKSKFIEMFGDPVTNPKRWREGYIENICDAIVDCPHSTPLHSEIITPYPSVRTSEIKNGAIEWSSMKYVSKDEYLKRIKRITPQPGDIIYGREGTYGDAAILPDGHNFCLGQRVILLRVNKEICNSIYFSSALRSDYVYSQAKLKNVGATVGHVNVKDIKQFIVPLPPLSIQNQFASFVELIEKQKNLFQQALDKMEISYKSLMQEYFG
jgi:type I restriction enzyme S subunit